MTHDPHDPTTRPDYDALLAKGWVLTPQGYVKGAWRIYHAETWCIAARFGAIERMVTRGFESPEQAATRLGEVAREVAS